ncbi:MAG TPA: diaminopimelate epimerase [Hyphomicrobiales bacterium]|nr:diaminopimelate epimerase [Hyphomicrobiales bacterium]
MSALANRPFVKMNGLGNEILVVDLRDGSPAVTPAEARAIAAAGGGLAFDQIMALHPGRDGADGFMRIYNADGSEVSACGNGTRCVARLLMDEGGRRDLLLETAAGPLPCIADAAGTIAVDMGRPRFEWQDIPLAHAVPDTAAVAFPDFPTLPPASMANVGNPHAIFWVADIAPYDLATLGPALEHHPLFPERANISLAVVTAPDAITLKVWERGAGLTLACGTAACAAAILGARTGRTGRKVTVTLPGGALAIEWRAADDHILMAGPVELEFRGRFDPAIFAGTAA